MNSTLLAVVVAICAFASTYHKIGVGAWRVLIGFGGYYIVSGVGLNYKKNIKPKSIYDEEYFTKVFVRSLVCVVLAMILVGELTNLSPEVSVATGIVLAILGAILIAKFTNSNLTVPPAS